MTASTVSYRRSSGLSLSLARNEGLIIIAVVFFALLLVVTSITPGHFGYFEVSFMASGGATLSLAAIGQTLVILVGGFDLSAGAVISLVNVVLASNMHDSLWSQIAMGLAALALGGAVGAFNGFFVAFVRMQSIVVTLSTMFLVRGITLLVMNNPGGQIAEPFTRFFTGSVIPGFVPAALVVIVVAIAVWQVIKRTRFGTAIYAVGSDEESAHSAGIPVTWTKFATYTLGGAFYGAAGMFISAQTGAGDPLVGDPLLLGTFAAVVLGGTALGGGRGGCLGSVFGAYTLILMVNILLVLNVSAYYSSVAEGVVLIFAVLASSLNRHSPIARYIRQLRQMLRASRDGTLPSRIQGGAGRLGALIRKGEREAPPAGAHVPWHRRNAELLRFITPAYACLIGIIVVTELVYGRTATNWHYYNSLLVLGSFLAILALGQGAVILVGGLDLSVPWTIALCGIVAASLIHGSNLNTVWAVPAVLAIGVLVGAFNGVGVVLLGLPPIVMTLASNGIAQGAALVYSNGTPTGFTSPALRWFMTGSVAGVTPVVVLVGVFAVFSVVLLGRTAFGRRIYAVGNSTRVATLSGVGVGSTLMGVYVLSGLCSALVGILLTGFSGQASLGMGDEYLLPSIAVVVVGGTLITGGRGHYIGMLGGVLLLTALQTLLAGTTLPHAVRHIVFGLVVLGAVLALRDRERR